jgi:ATP-binding cassette subfamily B multidrug efflux pump
MMKILKYLNRQQKKMILISMVFIVLQVWLDLKLPDYMSGITTLVETDGSSMKDILMQGIYMLLCAAGSMAASVAVGYIAAQVAAGLAKTLRALVYDRTLDFSEEEISHFSTSSLINRTTNDITQIQTLVSMGLQAIVKAPILAVWAIVKISGKSWQWTMATGVAVIVLIVMLTLTLIYAVPRFRKIQSLTDKLNRITREQLTGIRVVRACNAEDYQERKFEEANAEITKNNTTANRVMAIMSPGMTFINSALTLSVYWIGAALIESTTPGRKLAVFSDMVVFSNYAMQIIMAFMLLNMIFILLPRAQVSAKRILEVLDTKNHICDGNNKTVNTGVKGRVEFKNVSFRYPGAAKDTLSGISFTVSRGETVAFIGATGSGKTTLINLIPRLYDATSGEVLVDGVNVRDYRQETLHSRIGYVSQKPVLFSGTVESNVAYGDDNGKVISIDDVIQAVGTAQAEEFVKNMNGTYDARISQGGSNLSGGQKQRIAIARALARKPEILILDDSFSALDYKTDRALRSALNSAEKDATKLIVAQRIGTIRHADKIIVLEHGRAVGMGTHDELMKTCDTYREIASSQMSEEELKNV